MVTLARAAHSPPHGREKQVIPYLASSRVTIPCDSSSTPNPLHSTYIPSRRSVLRGQSRATRHTTTTTFLASPPEEKNSFSSADHGKYFDHVHCTPTIPRLPTTTITTMTFTQLHNHTTTRPHDHDDHDHDAHTTTRSHDHDHDATSRIAYDSGPTWSRRSVQFFPPPTTTPTTPTATHHNHPSSTTFSLGRVPNCHCQRHTQQHTQFQRHIHVPMLNSKATSCIYATSTHSHFNHNASSTNFDYMKIHDALPLMCNIQIHSCHSLKRTSHMCATTFMGMELTLRPSMEMEPTS